jgi:hypothetical protein
VRQTCSRSSPRSATCLQQARASQTCCARASSLHADAGMLGAWTLSARSASSSAWPRARRASHLCGATTAQVRSRGLSERAAAGTAGPRTTLSRSHSAGETPDGTSRQAPCGGSWMPTAGSKRSPAGGPWQPRRDCPRPRLRRGPGLLVRARGLRRRGSAWRTVSASRRRRGPEPPRPRDFSSSDVHASGADRV